MYLFYQLLLLLMAVAMAKTQNNKCEEVDEYLFETEINPMPSYYNCNEDEGYENCEETTTTIRSTTPKLPQYRTIICSNIEFFPWELFQYSYVEQPFEQYLRIQQSVIPSINQSTFLQFKTIRKLFLSHLNIQTILPGAFNGLSELKELRLDHNNLTKLQKGVYNSLVRLEILTLNNNKIFKIENLAFNGADNLLELHLQNNQISKLEKNLLTTQEGLKYLDLSKNPLTEYSLDGLSKLQYLNLAETLINKFDKDLSFFTMQRLNLSLNHLSYIDFAYLPKQLEAVDLSSNQLTTVNNCHNLNTTSVNLENNELKTINGTFKSIVNIQVSHNNFDILQNHFFNESIFVRDVDFSFNKILIIEKYAFRGLFSLTRLYLQHNKITTLDPFLFRDLHHLRVLNLSHNSIEQFQYGTFDSLSNLEIFVISNNHLKKLHENTFNAMSSLQQLYFDNNQISSLNAKVLVSFSRNLTVVSADNNSWVCRDLLKIHQYLRAYGVKIYEGHSYEVENFHGIACQNEQGLTDLDNETKMERFFNADFEKSKFVQYFNKDYSQSNFFKYLENYQGLGFDMETRMEKLISESPKISNTENKVLVFIAILQVIIVVILVCGLYCIINFVIKSTHRKQRKELSNIEIC